MQREGQGGGERGRGRAGDAAARCDLVSANLAPMTQPRANEPALWRVLTVAFLPTLIYSIGQGAIVPVIPSIAASLGADVAFAGFIAGSLLIGQAIGNLPAASLVARLGERLSMTLAALGTIAGALISVNAATPWMLLVGVLLQGLMTAAFALARQSFLTSYVPLRVRARAMSSLGGVFRSGAFVGPFVSAWMISQTQSPQANFCAFIVCSALVVVTLLVLPDVEKTAGRPAARKQVNVAPRDRLWPTIVRRRDVLLTLGIGAGALTMLRSARQVVLPLWGHAVGLEPGAISVVMGIGGAIDFALFFTSGWIMDKFGRAASGVPALVGLGIGFVVLGASTWFANPQWWFMAVTCWLALSNGIGSGIVMTLGADLADPDNPAPFLGAWHTITDASGATVPFLVSGFSAFAGLVATAMLFGGIGLFGAFLFARYIPRFVPKPPDEPVDTGAIEIPGD